MGYYIYVYLDIRRPGKFKYGEYNFDYEPFYIGKGKKYRYKLHLYSNSKYSANQYLKNKIQKIQNETGKNPVILKFKKNISEEEAHNIEINLIKAIGRKNNNGPLCNLTEGGEGISGYKHTDECKKLMSKIQKDRFKDPKERKKISKGLKKSEIWRKSISSAEYKSKILKSRLNPNSKFQKTMKSKEFSETMRKVMKGKGNHMYGLKGKANPNYGRGKNVYQYKLNGELVKEWDNANIVGNELNIDRVGVERRCKNNSHKHYKGFIWSYKNKPDETFIKFRSIKLIDGVYNVLLYNGEMLSYTSIRSLSKDLNINRKLLRSYVKRKIKK